MKSIKYLMGTVFIFFVAVFLTTCSGGGGGSSSGSTSSDLQISSLSETTANSFDSLTITGSGFTKGTSAISVKFIPENGDPSVMIPVSASDSGSVQVMVPTFTGLNSMTFTAETVDVQVVQFSSSSTYISNRITGLHVNVLPSVPNGIPVGAMTKALLSSTLNISGAIQTAQAGNTNFSNVAAAMTQFNTDLAPLISAVNTITNDPTKTVTLTTVKGTATLNAQKLAQSDQLAQALIAAIVKQGSIPTASSSSNCPMATGNTTYDSNLCSMQTYFQTMGSQVSAYQESKSSNQRMTKLEITPPDRAAMTLFSNMLYFAIGEAIFPPGGGLIATLVIAPIVQTIIVSLAVNHNTPPGTEIVQGVGLNFLDAAASRGVPIFGGSVDIIMALKAIYEYSPPRRGMLINSGGAGFMPGELTILDPNTGAPTTQLKVPDQAQGGTFDSTTLVVSSSSTCTYTCSAWGACQTNGTQTCTNVLGSPAGCTGTPPSLSSLTQTCTYVATCGNGICDSGENHANCPSDCAATAVCGDGICDAPGGETSTNCPSDCTAVCGDGICSAGESTTCPSDCHTVSCCTSTNNCPTEGLYSCNGGSCCCCPYGSRCNGAGVCSN